MKTHTRFGQRLALCLAVLLPHAVSFSHAAPPRGSAAAVEVSKGAGKPLEATLTVEPAELSPASTIEVVFPTAMVPKEKIGAKDIESPLTIAPALEGAFEWVSTRSGYYRLTQPPRFNQSYEFRLKTGLRDLSGKPLSTEPLATLESAPFSITRYIPEWFNSIHLQRSPELLIEFNDNVNVANAASVIRFVSKEPALTIAANVVHATGKDFKRNYREPTPTWTEEVSKVKPSLSEDSVRLNALVVKPVGPLPAAKGWQIDVAPTLTNSSGHDVLTPGKQIYLGDVQPFKVEQVSAHTPFDRPYFMALRFSRNLLPEKGRGDKPWTAEEKANFAQKFAATIRIEPSVPDLKPEISDGTLYLYGAFQLKDGSNELQNYKVTMNTDVESGDGLPLMKRVEVNVGFTPNVPYVSAPTFLNAQLAKGKGDFEISVANVKEVRVRVKKLNGSELLQASKRHQAYDAAYTSKNEKPKPKLKYQPDVDGHPGTIIYDHVFKIDKPIDKSELIRLNWREILGGAPAAPLYVAMEGVSKDELKVWELGEGSITETWVQFTDLGLMQKSNGKETLVFVTSLQTGKPVSGARVTVMGAEDKLIGFADTDANGVCIVPGDTPAYVLAEKDGDIAVLRCASSRMYSAVPYDISTAWNSVWKPRRETFVFSDRSLYRPGDTVHFKAYTRLFVGDDLRLDDRSKKARAILRDERYRIVLEKDVTFNERGSWSDDFKLPEDNVGRFTLTLNFGQENGEENNSGDEYEGRNGSYAFRVDDYRPNTFEVKLDAAALEFLPDRIKLPLRANYYMGKKLSSAKVAWNAQSTRMFTPPEAFEEYHFGEAPGWAGYGKDRDANGRYDYNDYENEWWVNGDLTLNMDGTAVLEMPQPPPNRSMLPQQVRAMAEVTDINQQTISASVEFEVPGTSFLLGLKGDRFFGVAGSDTKVEIVAIDSKGKPVPVNGKVAVKVERQEYHTLKIVTAGGGSTTKDQVVLRDILNESFELKRAAEDFPLSATVTFKPTRGGAYFVTAEMTDDQGKKVLSRLPLYVIGSGEFPWAMEDGARINLQPEKKTLKPGEEAVIVVKTPIAGTALVTVERNRVHHHFVSEISPDHPVIRIPMSDEEAPNVYVSVVVVRGAEANPKTEKMPEYKVGYCELTVESNKKDLNIVIAPEREEVRPGETLNIEAKVTDYAARPVVNAEVTLFAVDEGVLSLVKHQTPKPEAVFHRAFPLATANYTTFEDILPEDFAARERGNKGFVIGGGGDEEDAPMQVRKKFVATPLWLATVMTDAEGKVKTSVTAPDNLTRYCIMAVAAHGLDRFGHGESAFKINKPLMIEPVVPRFARLGDELLLKAVLHNTTPHRGEVEITLELDNTADFIREQRFFIPAKLAMPTANNPKVQKHTVAIEAGATTAVAFPVRFNQLGTATWKWTAKTTQWTANTPMLTPTDAVVSTFEVEHPLPELREVRYARIGDSEKAANLAAKVNPALLEGEGIVKVSVSTSRLFEARDALSYVLQYPYGCAEQTSSSTIPWLALGGYQSLFPDLIDAAKTKEAIQSGVNRLLRMVTDEGALAYWPGATQPSLFASAYGGMVLLRARDSGAFVPAEVVEKLMQYLSKELRGVTDEKDYYRISESALALYTLARAGKAEVAYQNRLHAVRDKLPETARLCTALAMCLSKAPDQQIYEMLGLKLEVKGGRKSYLSEKPARTNWSHWVGNKVNLALRLIAYTHLGLTEDAEKLAQEILSSRNGLGEWGNTFTNAWTLTALSAYERSVKKEGSLLVAKLIWGDRQEELKLNAVLGSAQTVLPLASEHADASLKIELADGLKAFSRIEFKGYPPNRDFSGENKGYAINRKYEKLMPDGTMTDIKDLQVGDMVVVTLVLETHGEERYLAINDPLPSVLEAINPEFDTQNARSDQQLPVGVENWFCDFREVRSDRALFFTNYAPVKGRFQMRYLARVIAEGDTIAPPARIEAMYQPEKYGLSATQRLKVMPSGAGQVAGQ